MSTLNYTTTVGDPALDRAFEAALAAAREGTPEPLPHLVGGERIAAGDVFERADPCDAARTVSRARHAPDDVIARAVAAARAAQPAWAATPLAERTAALRAVGARIAERLVEVAGVVSAETGKVRMEAVPEVQEGVDLIEAYCAGLERHDGYRIPLGRLSEAEDNVSVMLPYGVFAVICPFNFPFALAVNMAAGALVCGNAVVLKPAEETPRSSALLGEVASGLPPGVLNVVHGDDRAGRALVAAGVDGVAFTGSAEAGHAIARTLNATPPVRPLIAEMGGKNPAVVTRHADLDRAAEGIVDAAVAEARRDGEVVHGGERRDGFARPTLVTGLPRGHRLTREELFLPFLTVTAVDSLDEALEEANAAPYGLTAGIFSEDESERQAFLDRIQAGVVYVNRRQGATTGAWPGIQSFCGWKASGMSGKGGLGPHYLPQFMREQSRTVMTS